jgi:hypothetical protein
MSLYIFVNLILILPNMSNKNKGFIEISVRIYFKIDYLQVQVNNLRKYYFFANFILLIFIYFYYS